MSVAVCVELFCLALPWQGHAHTDTHSISVSESLPNYDQL